MKTTCKIATGLLAALALGYSALLWADSDALWNIVNRQCVPNQQAAGQPAPCAEVGLSGGYAVLKDRNGWLQYLLIPTVRLSGIESPELLNERAPDYWEAAWRARSFLEQRYGRAIPRELLSLTINSQYGRTQNQLHIHISCTDATVRQQLDDLKDSLNEEWRELPVELQGHAYWARTLAAKADGGPEVDPFKALAAGLPEAGLDMGRYGLALVATRLADGRDGFILLSSRASLIGANRASVEELQDHACSALRAGERGEPANGSYALRLRDNHSYPASPPG
ncbi:CDP-diacylglycerol diphosphatase [Chromobacterium haemolyticum]|uniref:CDP-diacylglycerol diphosphatase n=1 Tax=Chromobacterium haemolyticum TaxID=394935 RepID=UPI00068ACCF3|nr:CDP-diacylglycerol diphosphatase [Chromobacterium haemolyticum]